MTDNLQWWQPENFSRRHGLLKQRAAILKAVRNFFDAQGYDAVETPALQISPGVEVHLKAFATEFSDPWGNGAQPYYLHTSPEFSMKKLLVAGCERIYQIAKVYRNGEKTERHHPEFTMVEWYQTHQSLSQMMDQTEALVRACADAVGAKTLQWQGHSCDPFQAWERLSVPQAFAKYCDIDLLATTPNPQQPDRDLLATQAKRIGMHVSDNDQWDDIFFKLMMEHIEPHLGYGVPCILHDYPVSMAALARPNPHDHRVAERFEAYACGVELCNAFGELTDVTEQRRRFDADMDLKFQLYSERYPIDEDFLAALSAGMPDSSGNALGLDRLIMLILAADKIEDVLWVPVAT